MMDPNNEQDREMMARLHNQPPEPPRDRMWERIDAARVEHRGLLRPEFNPRRGPSWRILRLGGAVAAILVVGIFIGRFTRQSDPIPAGDSFPLAGQPNDPIPSGIAKDVYKLAAQDLFSRADFLLTDFKVRSCGKTDLAEVPQWAGGMLVQTRLLMGTSVADDSEMNSLLDELELVLAQIVGLSQDNCARDMAWIRQGLQERSTIDRLRTMSAGSKI